MPGLVEVVGVRQLVRDARKLADTELLADLSAAWRRSEQIVRARMSVLASATGRAQDERVAATLRGAATKDRAVIRVGAASIPWWAGAAFGANRELTRSRSSGRYVGFRQFPAPRPGGGWIFGGIADSADAVGDQLEDEIVRIIDKTLETA